MSEAVDRTMIQTIADALGIDVYEDYSGRFMFGDRCFGLVTESRGFAQFMARLGSADWNLAERLSRALRQDDMGKQTIYYFPGFTIEAEGEREEAL